MSEKKKLSVGEVMPDFTYDSPFEKGLKLSETVKKASKTAILFLRYYGCTLCQYEMHKLAIEYDKVIEAGGHVLVVLQSKPEGIAAQIKEDTFPFEIVCDPEMELYNDFSIDPAESMAKMADAGTMVKIAKATAAGYKHGEYEGNELQLPASFIINPNLSITYAHYGKSAGDTPSASELAKLLD